MRFFRRFRPLLAGFALLLSPGGLAPWLQLAHACPAPAAMEVSAAHAGHAGEHPPAHAAGHEADSKGPAHNLHTCLCIGACQTAALGLARSTSIPVPATVVSGETGFHAVPATAHPHHPELHPPATAPPVVI